LAADVLCQEALERPCSAGPDLEKVAVGSRDLMDFLDLWPGSYLGSEPDLVGMGREIDEDERTKREVDPVRVEHGMIAADNAGAIEASHTLIRSRHGKANGQSDLSIGQLIVGLEQT